MFDYGLIWCNVNRFGKKRAALSLLICKWAEVEKWRGCNCWRWSRRWLASRRGQGRGHGVAGLSTASAWRPPGSRRSSMRPRADRSAPWTSTNSSSIWNRIWVFPHFQFHLFKFLSNFCLIEPKNFQKILQTSCEIHKKSQKNPSKVPSNPW